MLDNNVRNPTWFDVRPVSWIVVVEGIHLAEKPSILRKLALVPIKYASAPTKKGWIMVKVWSMNKKNHTIAPNFMLVVVGWGICIGISVCPRFNVQKRRNTYTDVVTYSMMVTFWWIKNLQCTSIYLESVVNMSLAWSWPIRKPTG